MTASELNTTPVTSEAIGASGEALYRAIQTLHTQIGRMASKESVTPGVEAKISTTAFSLDSIATTEEGLAKFKAEFGAATTWELQEAKLCLPPQGKLRATLTVRTQRQSSLTGERVIERANKTRPKSKYPIGSSAVEFHLNARPWEKGSGLDEAYTSLLHMRADLAPQGTAIAVRGSFGEPFTDAERHLILKRGVNREVNVWRGFVERLIGESADPHHPQMDLGGKEYTIWEKTPASPQCINALVGTVGIVSQFVKASTAG